MRTLLATVIIAAGTMGMIVGVNMLSGIPLHTLYKFFILYYHVIGPEEYIVYISLIILMFINHYHLTKNISKRKAGQE